MFSDHFSRYEPGVFAPLRDVLLTAGDHYRHLADLGSYLAADARAHDALCEPRRLGAQSHLKRRRFREVFQRSYDRRLCGRYLER